MDAKKKKRLEEVAEEYALTYKASLQKTAYRSFEAGVELGYKEAIAQAKEWWWENIDALFGHKMTKDEFDNLITDFEADMNKFWEEKK